MRKLMTAFLGVFLMVSGSGSSFAQTPSPLILAAEQGDIAALQQALTAGNPLEARDARQRTALMIAVQNRDIETARLLIEAGADVNAKDGIEDTPYLLAGASGQIEILRLTLAHGADLASINRYGGTALIPASEHGYVETVEALIAAGINVDHVNRLGWTALLEAVLLGDGGPDQVTTVQRLISAGADLNLADLDGVTPLGHARARGYQEIASILEQAGAQ